MKMIAVLLPVMMLASVSFAEGTATSAAAPAAAAAMTKKEAKKACKEEGKKGKSLKTCIKEKMGK